MATALRVMASFPFQQHQRGLCGLVARPFRLAGIARCESAVRIPPAFAVHAAFLSCRKNGSRPAVKTGKTDTTLPIEIMMPAAPG
jgi:hypothetical protein